jgi:cyclophilin family peptidyl-prolyl cis-trans isomerase
MKYVRISNTARYSATFTPSSTFTSDSQTVGLWTMTDGVGSTAADSSGHGYTATLAPDSSSRYPEWFFSDGGGSTNTPCVGLRFNRSNFCNAGGSAAYNTLPLTIEFWARCTEAQTHWMGGAASGALGGQGDAASWRIESTRPYLVVNSTPVARVNNDINDGVWHHVAFTINAAGDVTSYLDGAVQTSAAGAAPGLAGSIDLAIGAGGWNTPVYNGANADLHDVRISNSVKYSGDFTPASTLAVESDTVALWHLTDGTGQTATDASGHGHDATLRPESDPPTWVTDGTPSSGLRFNGGNYAHASNGSGQFDLTTGTYEFWFRGTLGTVNETRLLATYSGGTGFLIGLLGSGTSLRFNMWGLDGSLLSLSQTNAVNVLDGNWHHIAVTLAGSGGTATLWLNGQRQSEGTVGGAPTVPTRFQTLPAATLGVGLPASAVDLRAYFGVPGVNGPVAQFNTVMGKFNVELLTNAAPRHVTNFMAYANANSYAGTFIHRSYSFDSTTISIVQGGGYGLVYTSGGASFGSVATGPAVPLEYKLPNVRGTLAAARTTNVNSATSQWFVNVRDNSTILGTDNGGGYTVFGRVLGSGMGVVDSIAALPTYDLGSPLDTMPLRNVQANQKDLLIDNLIIVNGVTMIPVYPPTSASPAVLGFSANSSAPAVASVSLSGYTLAITPLAVGSATVTVQVVDVNTNTVSGSFLVTVRTPKAQMLAPAPGSTLPGAATTFSWDAGVNATGYALWIGSTAGAYDLAAESTGTNLSRTVTLPVDGRTLYVRLWSLINGTWQSTDHTYAAVPPVPAQMLSPANGSTNTSASVTFNWNAGAGVSQYALWVGSASNSSDLFAQVLGTNRSRTLTLPTDGRALYVRLWSQGYNGWVSNDYRYKAFAPMGAGGLGGGLLPATLNTGYNQTLQVNGGISPYTWSWSGNVPPGLNLSADGTLSGTPTALGIYNFTLTVRDSVSTTTNQNLSLAVQGQDLAYALVMKSQRFWQTNTGAAALASPAFDPTPFEFRACLKQASTGTVNSATVQLPDTTLRALGPLTPPSAYSDLVWGTNFTSKAALDATFINGLYTFTITAAHDGANNLPASLTGDNYPSATPHVSNWTAAQSVNPAANFTLTWDTLTGGTTNDLVTFRITDPAGTNRLFETPARGFPGALNGTNRLAVIPAGTLTTNQTYRAEITWWRFGPQNTTNYPPATGGDTYGRQTRFTLATISPAQMLAPTNGTTLASGSVTFNWNRGLNASQYALWVGSASNGYDLAAVATGTNLSQRVTIPATGLPIYVRLWSFINGEWQPVDTSYIAPTPAKAVMTSPANGSTNTSASVTFNWTAGAGVSQYAMWIGSASNGSDLYAAVEPGLSRTLTLPMDGRPFYVRLWSLMSGIWNSNDYNYRAFNAVKARLTNIVNGATLGAASVNFTWDVGNGATQYRLTAGASAGASDIFNGAAGAALSQTIALPADGRRLYVTLWSLIGGAWKQNNYTFTAYTAASSRAAMITPTNGAVFASNPVPLSWSAGTGVSQYALWVDSTPGGHGLLAQGTGTNRTYQLTSPLDGDPVYVRLWSLIGSAWEFNDYAYGTTGTTPKAVMTSPANGSDLAAASTTFTWSGGTGVSQYALWAGSAPGTYDLYAAGCGTNRTQIVTLPADGSPIYVRLWSLISGAWKSNDYFYNACFAP